MTTAATVAAGVVLLLVYMAGVLGLRSFCRWAVVREEARHHAATFEAAFIPDSSEVAAAEAENELLVMLAQAQDDVASIDPAKLSVLQERVR